ncbi:testis-specific protein TSX-like [Acomys russatus]|uniref:testis-specific protein TSX-like n=1 Tax=Acomys russatus TaxID=60746 RepID=UPI0021E30666|nr:testis-specific protein TSX-like [Acomys russatus]
MSEKQDPQTSEAACSAADLPAFEDEESWLFKVLGIMPKSSSALDDKTDEQEHEPLDQPEFLHLQDILQEDKVNSTDDSKTCQTVNDDDDDSSNSDSDTEDNVKVIIGNIKTNPAMYMEMLTNLNSSQADRGREITKPGPPRVNTGSLICNVGVGGPAPAAGAPLPGGPAPAEEKKVEAKKEESEESDDGTDFGLSD